MKNSIKSILVASLLVSPVLMFAETETTTDQTTTDAAQTQSQPETQAETPAQTQAVEQKVNINTADAATLAAVHGITKHTADAIVSYRNAHGPYKSVGELIKVKGITKKMLKKLANSLTV